ncbi:hypothetical protein AGMMS49959_07330 [Planctomycetales bacterium]|nr:hypothetical protein AGMMS49959_07330 [Planctomycetales bacterium]
MMNVIFSCLTIAIAAYCAWRFFLGKDKGKSKEKSFDFGDLSFCNGDKCSPNNECTKYEKMFCRDVMRDLFPRYGFIGQHYVVCASKIYKPDFALITHDNRKIAIELDDYESHSKNSYRNFNEQLSRQNEFILAGWQVLRFSNNQARYFAEDCIDQIKKLVKGDLSQTKVPLRAFRDIFVPEENDYKNKEYMSSELKPLGGLWSDKRRRWYFPAEKISAEIERILREKHPEWKINGLWFPCIYPDCAGIANVKNGQYGEYCCCRDNPAHKFDFKRTPTYEYCYLPTDGKTKPKLEPLP